MQGKLYCYVLGESYFLRKKFQAWYLNLHRVRCNICIEQSNVMGFFFVHLYIRLKKLHLSNECEREHLWLALLWQQFHLCAMAWLFPVEVHV